MTNEKDIATRVAEKKAEIEHYKGVLDRYTKGPGRTNRWYYSGKTHLEELQAELAELESLMEAERQKDEYV